jgi:hypothetical protein
MHSSSLREIIAHTPHGLYGLEAEFHSDLSRIFTLEFLVPREDEKACPSPMCKPGLLYMIASVG